MRYPSTPAERRYETQLDTLCEALVAGLSKLAADNADCTAVLALYTEQPHNTALRKRLLADAFQRLDEQPSHYGTRNFSQPWHSLMRQARNSRDVAPKLFALWD